MKLSLAALALMTVSVITTPVQAQDNAPQSLSFSGHDWRIADDNASVSAHRGREALTFAGRAWLDTADFEDFVAEFDVMFEPAGFFGVGFRAQDDRNFEDIYLRNAYPGTVDALQYMPIINGVSGWQIYTDARFNSAPEFEAGQWVRVRLVVIGDTADVYIDDDEPVLHIPDLQRDPASGYFSLRATESSAARFADFSIREAGPGDAIAGRYTPFDREGMPDHLFVETLPDTLITHFTVSSVFEENRFANALRLPGDALDGLSWQTLEIETNGIANLARLAGRTGEANTVMVRTRIHAEATGLHELRFGYSDRVRLYLNGDFLYAANNGWQSRDWDFYGRVGLFDSVGLPLRAGENELVAVVSETFGGWAFMADLPDRTGLTID